MSRVAAAPAFIRVGDHARPRFEGLTEATAMSSSRRQPVRTAERVADHGRRRPLRHEAPPRADYPSASAPVATDFHRCNPTEVTVKGREAPRLHALLPMSASACGAL